MLGEIRGIRLRVVRSLLGEFRRYLIELGEFVRYLNVEEIVRYVIELRSVRSLLGEMRGIR